MRKTKQIVLSLFILLLLFVVFLFWAASYLDYDSPVKADNLVVEGWLQACELEQIGERCRDINELIVVGNELSLGSGASDKLTSHFQKYSKTGKKVKVGRWLYANSTLLFDPELIQLPVNPDSVRIIVKAKGTDANGRFAHFYLIVNGKFVDGDFTSGVLSNYLFDIATEKGGINSIGIRFDNDCMSEGRDRNLFVYSVIVAGKEIAANKNTCLITARENRFTTGFSSKAEAAMSYLKAAGTIAKEYRVVTFRFAKENQTLAAAQSFREWVSGTDIRSFNIVSAGLHSRRSLVTYKKVLGKDYNIGIISLKSTRYNKGNWWKSPGGWFALIDESVSYFVNLL